MQIDHLTIDSLMTWGQTWVNVPIRLEIAANEWGEVICEVYRRDPCYRSPLSGLHPVAHTKVGQL